jgi:hypothetical protein
LDSISRFSDRFFEDRLFGRGSKPGMEGLRVSQLREATANKSIAVCDLAMHVECAGAMLQEPNYFLLDGVLKAIVAIISVGAAIVQKPQLARRPFASPETADLNPDRFACH